MSEIHVRFANQGDLEFVSQDHYIPVEVVSRKIDLKEVVIAELDGQPIGYLRLDYLWSTIPYIALIAVDPSHRRMGVGKTVLDFVIKDLSGRNYEWLYSSSQADEPEPQAWHRHLGFQDCGIITGINEGGVSEVFFRLKVPRKHA